MDLDPKYQNLPSEYKCENCGAEVNAPTHCGHAMHLEDLDEGISWVCWMGAKCGHQDYEACCQNPSVPIKEPLGY